MRAVNKEYQAMVVIAFLFISFYTVSWGQENLTLVNGKHIYKVSYPISQIEGAIIIPLPDDIYDQSNNRIVKSAYLKLIVNTGENYKWGNLTFEVNLNLNIIDLQGNTDFIINNEQSEVQFFKDFTSDLNDVFTAQSKQFLTLQNNTQFSDITNSVTNTNMTNEQFLKLKNELTLIICYTIEYQITNDCGSQLLVKENTPERGRYYTFSWDPLGCHYPNYHFQLLRLYNFQEQAIDEWEEISTTIEWEKALDFIVESSDTSITLAIGEGTGFYVWRVRPIGSQYPGGITDVRNFGNWNIGLSGPQSKIKLNKNSLISPPFFFFEDPDEDKNYLYSRIFTEQGKVHETISYASSLLHTKQEQAQFSSLSQTLITQHQQDFSGRSAISTLPIPISGTSGLTYQEKLLSPDFAPDSLLTPFHFDMDSNFRQPPPLEDNLSALNYYSSNNPDLSISDAEGHPYQRSLFQNDGTGRIKEQSGVGKTHRIVDDHNSGKTIKTMYAVPSEDELVQMFGAEAPHHQSVRKVITIDENGTVTIQYITNTGNLIATALSFLDSEETDHILSIDNQPATAFTVSEKVTKNVFVDGNLISNRRLSIIRPTPLDITYNISCLKLQKGCMEATLDCGYDLNISLHNLKDNTSSNLYSSNLSADCDQENHQIEIQIPTIQLQPGEYVIEKKLIPKRPPSGNVRIQADKIENQITPLTDLIIARLNEVEELEQMENFYRFLNELAIDVGGPVDQLIAKYNLPDDYDTSANQFIQIIGNPPFTAIVGSTCCTIEIPIYYTPVPVCENLEFDADGKLIPSSYPAYGGEGGFENYAIEYLAGSGIVNENEASQLLYYGTYFNGLNRIFEGNAGLIQGWGPGELDEMIFNMLTDEYPCEANESAQIHYTCDEIFSCWTGALSIIRDQIREQNKYLASRPNTTASGAIDKEAGDENTQNNHINDNSEGKIGFPMSIFFPDDPAQAVEDAQIGLKISLNEHLVKSLLDCTGYHFAAIFPEGFAGPWPIGYQHNSSWNPPTWNNGKSTPFFGIRDKFYAFKYFHYKYTHPEIEVMSCFRHPDSCYNEATQSLIPCCTDGDGNPIPCDYCNVGWIECDETYEDWNCGQRYAFFEKIRNTPPSNSSTLISFSPELKVDWDALCEKITKEIPDVNWEELPCRQPIIYLGPEECTNCSSMDTCDFYFINHYLVPNFDEEKPWKSTTIAGELILKKENACKTGCLQKQEAILDSLFHELDRKCYLIGRCASTEADHIIPKYHIAQILESLLGECLSKCKIETVSCVTSATCRPLNIPRNYFGKKYMKLVPELYLGVAGDPTDEQNHHSGEIRVLQRGKNITLTEFTGSIRELSFTEAFELEQAQNWEMQIEFPSKCNIETSNFTCDERPVPPLDYYQEVKNRLRGTLVKELDIYKEEGEIIPELKSPSKPIRVGINNN